jgi:hypothetical protein
MALPVLPSADEIRKLNTACRAVPLLILPEKSILKNSL